MKSNQWRYSSLKLGDEIVREIFRAKTLLSPFEWTTSLTLMSPHCRGSGHLKLISKNDEIFITIIPMKTAILLFSKNGKIRILWQLEWFSPWIQEQKSCFYDFWLEENKCDLNFEHEKGPTLADVLPSEHFPFLVLICHWWWIYHAIMHHCEFVTFPVNTNVEISKNDFSMKCWSTLKTSIGININHSIPKMCWNL